MKRVCLCLCVFFAITSFLYGEDRELRTWTITRGDFARIVSRPTYSVEGYLKEIIDDGETVILVINGRKKKISVSRLSSEDKEYVIYIQALDEIKKSEKSETSPNSDRFNFFGSNLHVLRPVSGVRLGETFDGLSKKMSDRYIDDNVSFYPMSEFEKEHVKMYFIDYTDDFYKGMIVLTIDDRVYSVKLYTKDQSDQKLLLQNALENKYSMRAGVSVYYDEKSPPSDFPFEYTRGYDTFYWTSVYIDGEIRIQQGFDKISALDNSKALSGYGIGNYVVYRHGPMGLIFEHLRREHQHQEWLEQIKDKERKHQREVENIKDRL